MVVGCKCAAHLQTTLPESASPLEPSRVSCRLLLMRGNFYLLRRSCVGTRGCEDLSGDVTCRLGQLRACALARRPMHHDGVARDIKGCYCPRFL
jgi:hypothetical protein